MMNFRIAEVGGVMGRDLVSQQHLVCPFSKRVCKKTGRVCTIFDARPHMQEGPIRFVGDSPTFATLCPHRFEQDGLIDGEIRKLIAPDGSNRSVKSRRAFRINYYTDQGEKKYAELDWLYTEPRRDMLIGAYNPLFGVEFQSQYFTGSAMDHTDTAISSNERVSKTNQNPDPKSAIKRLWHQIEVKLPKLRQAQPDSKMIIVVDRNLADCMAVRDENIPIADADIILLIVDYVPSKCGSAALYIAERRFATLVGARQCILGGTVNRPKLWKQIDTL